MTAPADASGPALPAGTRLGEFTLRSVLGMGGFSIVYLAFDPALEREVAIKEFLPAGVAGRGDANAVVLRDPGAAEHFQLGLRSFINEARLLARFDHPSLLKVYRFWEANGTAYMAMPVLRGQTLKAWRQARGTPPDEAALRALLGPLLDAIAALHDEGVYHRDIAPDNIHVAENGRPVLMDFGAARRVMGDAAQSLTAILKPAYAPIEQYGETPSLRQGPWTDLYALGATLHYLLLLKPPQPAVTRAVHDDQPALATLGVEGCSAAFLQAIDRMLAPRPADRPQSVAALRELLGTARAADDRFAEGSGPWAADRLPASVPRAPAADAPARASGGWNPFAGLFRRSDRGRPPVPAPPGPPLPPSPSPSPSPPPAPAADEFTQVFAGQPPLQRLAADPALPAADRTMLMPSAPRAAQGSVRALALLVLRSDVASLIGHTHPVAAGSTPIGRHASAGLRVDDRLLSREHARLESGAGRLDIIDLGSVNGTYVNGIRIAPQVPCALHVGATIQLGSTVLAVSLPGLEPLPDLTGQLVAGRYLLQDNLRSSPKGAVYRAEKRNTGAPVAIKLLAPDYAAWPGHRERFEAEARIAARLAHPHICRLDDIGEAEIELRGSKRSVPFSTHAMLAGGTLAEQLQRAGELPLDTIERWLAQAAAALAHAHALGVVHGNLKPTALGFDDAGHLYVTDFAGAGAGAGALMAGAPAFMAPEQWAGQAATPASDQFALAVLAWGLLAGGRPFDGQEDPERRERNLASPPPALHEEARRRLKRELSPAVTAVVHQALAVAPAERHASVDDFAAKLVQALRSPRGPKPRQVFISYRRDNSAILATFVHDQLLHKHEITSFVDTQGLDGAARFPLRIERAIRDCDVFVCLLGAGTLMSGYVKKEIALAFELRKPMIPVFQEDYAAPADGDAVDPAVADLLQFDGIPLLDRRNLYVFEAVAALARQIRATIDDACGGAARPG